MRILGIGLALSFGPAGEVFADVWEEVAPVMRSGDYSQALALLEAAEAADPNDYQIQRVMGVCLMELGRLKEAEAHLRTAIRLQPDTSAARYDLAQVLALRGSIDEATGLLREVIDLAPESSYAARAEKVLPGLIQLKQTLLVRVAPKRWDLYLRVAGEYDDNVPARSRHDPQDGTHSMRLVSSLRVAYRFPDQHMDAPWPTLEAGYSLYRTFHDEEMYRDFDVMSHRGTLELSRQGRFLGRWIKAGVEGSYAETELGDNPFSETMGAEASVSMQLLPAFVGTLGYAVAWKDFDNQMEFPEFFSRDGHDQEVSLDTYTYLLENQLILGLSYGYLWNEVDGSQFELDRHRIRASATVSLPYKFRLYTSASYSTEDYGEFVPDPKREDDAVTVYVSLSRQLWNEAWRAEANYTHHRSESNQEFAEYDRNVYGLAVSWSP